MAGAETITDEYRELKNDFIDTLISLRCEDLLEQSLLVFEQQVNSKRSQAKIKTLFDLVRVLEKRDELSSSNVGILKLWADSFRCGSGRSLIEQFEKLHSLSSTNYSCFQCKTILPYPELCDIFERKKAEQSKENLRERSKDSDVREAFAMIAPYLSYSWRDLARKLDITEYEMDDIEETKKRLVDMSYEVFKLWCQKHGDDVTTNHLRLSLLEIRRKDLHDKLLKAS